MKTWVFFSPFAGSVCLYICERDEVEARRTERESGVTRQQERGVFVKRGYTCRAVRRKLRGA